MNAINELLICKDQAPEKKLQQLFDEMFLQSANQWCG